MLLGVTNRNHIWFPEILYPFLKLWVPGTTATLGEVEIFRMDNQLNRAKQHGNGQNVPLAEWLLWKK
jgi:hypothetical protein